MKVFLSSTYIDLIEHRIIPAGDKEARDAWAKARAQFMEVLRTPPAQRVSTY